MRLTKFGIVVKKTTSLFTSIRDSKISRGCEKTLEIPEGRGGGINFGGQFWKIQRGGGSYGKSLPWGGGVWIFSRTTHLENHMVGFLSKSPGPNLRNLELLARKKWQKLSKTLACLELAQQ